MSNVKSYKDAVRQVYMHFEMESKRQRPFFAWTSIKQRTMHAFKISRKQLISILDNGKSDQPVKHSSKIEVLDSFNLAIVKRTIFQMFENKEYVTIKKLKDKLSADHDLNVTKFVLWKSLHKLKFKFEKLDNNKIGMTERQDIVNQRAYFLREIKKLREKGSPIIYLDETWVDTHHLPKRHWHLPGEKFPKVPFNKGQRLVILHAGSKDIGFIPNCELVFKSKSTDGRDYHTEMNGLIFEQWVTDQLEPNIPPNSTIIMDNASYHSVRVEGTSPPTSATRKGDMQNWLKGKSVPFDNKLLKPALYEIIKLHKTNIKIQYKVDEYLKSKGHLVLRLPPYNCDLNPIELIWGDLKGYVGRKNQTYTLKDTKTLVHEGFQYITQSKWQNACLHVENKVEPVYWQTDGLQQEIPRVVIDFEEDDEDSEYEFD